MLNFEDMDVAMELASLDFEVDWDEVNILDGLTTPSPSHSPHVGLRDVDANVLPSPNELQSSTVEALQTQNNEEPGTELAAASPSAETPDSAGSVAKATIQAQGTTESSSCENPALPPPVLDDPNPLPHLPDSSAPLLINEALSGHPSSSLVGLISERAVSSIQDQDTTRMSCFNRFYHSRNENLHMLQGLGIPNEYSTNNQLLEPNIIANTTFSGTNYQSSSYPALLQKNPAEAGAGICTGAPNGPFMTSQISALSPLQNQSNSSHRAWNSRPQNNQFSAANTYDSQYSPNYMRCDSSASYGPPQQFTTLLSHVSHATEMQKVFDLQALNSMQPFFPTYPRLEPYSHLQSDFPPKLPNPYDHQHGYRAMLPEPAVPPGPAMYPNYHPQPSPFSRTYNSFASGSSVPPRYPHLYDHQNNRYHSHAMMPNGLGSVGSIQLSGPLRVSDQRSEYNRLLNTPSLQWQSSTLHGYSALSVSRLTSLQALSSRVLEPSGTRMTEGTSSRVYSCRASEPPSLPRPEAASGILLQQLAPVSANRVTTQRYKGTISESSSPRAQPSMLKILNQNAEPTFTSSGLSTTIRDQQNQNLNLHDQRETWIEDLEKELAREESDTAPEKFRIREQLALQGQQESPRRGRPPQLLEVGESSSPSKRPKWLQKDSSGTGKAETTREYEEAYETPENEEMEDQNDDPLKSSYAPSPRQVPNAVYDPTFERMGLPVDPHFRSFKALPEPAPT